MKLCPFVLASVFGLSFALASCTTASSNSSTAAPAKDRLDIRQVNFLKASAPGFVVFSVLADYTLASSAEGNVSLAIDLMPGSYTLVTEQRVQRGSGTVELLAECKRSQRTRQGLNVSLTEYPGGLPRKTLESQIRSVALPTTP